MSKSSNILLATVEVVIPGGSIKPCYVALFPDGGYAMSSTKMPMDDVEKYMRAHPDTPGVTDLGHMSSDDFLRLPKLTNLEGWDNFFSRVG